MGVKLSGDIDSAEIIRPMVLIGESEPLSTPRLKPSPLFRATHAARKKGLSVKKSNSFYLPWKPVTRGFAAIYSRR